MARNSDFKTTLERVRRRFPRSAHGRILGVFRGIAEGLGFSVCWTRVAGVFLLLIFADLLGAGKNGPAFVVMAATYVLLAVFMSPPRPAGYADAPGAGEDEPAPSVFPRVGRRSFRPAAVPFRRSAPVERVDLAELDRQADSLNRRIQRMETIVTDRQFDWDRRMER